MTKKKASMWHYNLRVEDGDELKRAFHSLCVRSEKKMSEVLKEWIERAVEKDSINLK